MCPGVFPQAVTQQLTQYGVPAQICVCRQLAQVQLCRTFSKVRNQYCRETVAIEAGNHHVLYERGERSDES